MIKGIILILSLWMINGLMAHFAGGHTLPPYRPPDTTRDVITAYYSNQTYCVGPATLRVEFKEVVLQNCGTPGQQWKFNPSGSVSLAENYCLDIFGGSPKENTPVIMYPCYNPPSANQLWRVEGNRIVSKLNGLCLTSLGPKLGLIMKPCNMASFSQFFNTPQLVQC
ncbi:hypothetical protein DFA_00860 [Cavenderia fasciculata]|uniref:Ricin B lectin domain-containing protein n=1 Tax=Cavenderia fasciculata TaxID=261658 RepID=F4PU65_CACFS|nr:uncharacterized protein DFA_00860 [Cavenderia fasciculata]EGG20991.1 hypothetical protein DFA_00860 [Cavenderia fasciculata]|eukprot:XP_004358841.1 hypothetical protein DFA_00860 [Cavenderia fasciculata]